MSALESAESALESVESALETAESALKSAESALEPAETELESADSSTDSNADSAKVDVWVWAFNHVMCYLKSLPTSILASMQYCSEHPGTYTLLHSHHHFMSVQGQIQGGPIPAVPDLSSLHLYSLLICPLLDRSYFETYERNMFGYSSLLKFSHHRYVALRPLPCMVGDLHKYHTMAQYGGS